jgi:hypothetical protein
MTPPRRYRYVGPAELGGLPRPAGCADVVTPADLERWAAGRDPRDTGEPATFVVTVTGTLRLAPRHCEHVACAGGPEVLAAGEITLVRAPAGWTVTEVSNQSTGFCPDPDSWPAVARALDGPGVRHPDGFTQPVVFRRCGSCGERNIVRDGDFTCALCAAPLAVRWNFDALGY